MSLFPPKHARRSATALALAIAVATLGAGCSTTPRSVRDLPATDPTALQQLTGKVATPAEKDRAESIAKAVDGVKSVDNQLTVTPK